MTIKEFETLKVGYFVSPTRGRNKGHVARVSYIHDVTDSDGYREIIVFANYLDPTLHTKYKEDIMCSYRSLRRVP